MRDEERAERLAKAIEEVLQGHVPEDLNDEELNELLELVEIRLDAAELAASAGKDVQEEILKRIIARLEARDKDRADDARGATAASSNEPLPNNAPDETDVQELQHIIELRRRMAEHAASVSEQHQEAVWQQVQARIQAERSEKRGLFRWPFGHRHHEEAQDLGAALDRLILGEPIWESADSNFDEMLNVAHARKAAAEAAGANAGEHEARVWARLHPRILARLMPHGPSHVFERGVRRHLPRLALAGTATALLLAVLGPLPVTGLTHHPAAEAARFVGRHIGVVETSSPPAIPPPTEVVQGEETSATDASQRLGLPVRQPAYVPEGYHHASSRYFETPITADEGGVLVLAYEGPTADDTILIFQERVSATGIAVERGYAQDISLADGTRATVVTGAWRSVDSGVVWGSEGAQTIVFNRGDVRVTIHAESAFLPLSELSAMADSIAADAAPSQ